jgi:hypothetical protein
VICSIVNDDQPASLSLAKTVVNDNGGTAVAADFTLTAIGGTPSTTVTGAGSATNPAVPAGTYTLSETSMPGYTAGTWSCAITDAAGVQTTSAGTTVVVPNGGTVACSITNDDHAATLVLDKILTNDNGGTATSDQFTLTATGTTPAATTVSGGDTNPDAGSSLSFTVNAGSYTLSEAQQAGYAASTWACEGGTLAEDGVTLTIPNGATVTCTITNNDQPAT